MRKRPNTVVAARASLRVFQERVWRAPGGAALLRHAGFAEGAKMTLRLPIEAPLAPVAEAKALVDTIYRYKDGQWEAVPSPPNQYFDDAGNEVTEPGLPSRLEVGMGSKGKLMLRIPSTKGGDAIFEESDTEGEFNLLPAVMSGSGSFVPYLFHVDCL